MEMLSEVVKQDKRGDHEAAHGAEDDLRGGVLAAIRDERCADSIGCAGVALKTNRDDYPRWAA